MSVHEFYRLKALITLEQVNTTEWSKKMRILISKTAMVGCCKLSLYANGLVMSMRFIFGDDWNDVPCKSLFWSLAIMLFLWNRGPWISVYLYTRTACDRKRYFWSSRSKSVQKQIKSIDVDKVGSNNRALTAAFRLDCLEIRSRNEEPINSTRNMIYSLKVFYFLPYRGR